MRRVAPVVLEAVEVLVALAANLAPVGLVLLHVHAVGIGRIGQRVNYAVSSIVVEVQHLVLVAVHSVVLESILVFVSLVAPNHWALERLVLSSLHDIQMASRVVYAHFVVVVKRACRLWWAHLHHLRVMAVGDTMLLRRRRMLEMRGVVALDHAGVLHGLAGRPAWPAHAHEHVVSGDHLHDVVGVAGHVRLFHRRRWCNMRLFVVS